MSPPPIALILAAGRSARMGRDKARLTVAGTPVLAHLDRLMVGLGGTPVYSLRPDQRGLVPAGRTVLLDRNPGRGPLEGIAVALEAFPGHSVLAVPVDMPGLGPRQLRSLLVSQALAACLSADGRRSPLPSIWRPGSRQAVARAVASGRLGVGRTLDAVDASVIPVEAASLCNVNSPENLASARTPC